VVSLLKNFVHTSSRVHAVDDEMSGLLTNYLVVTSSVDDLLDLYVSGALLVVKDR
jgi:hypothetical protein